MKVYKGTDKNLQCRGFQYEIGKEYVEDKADLCHAGFHGCENALDVLSYYPPTGGNRFVEADLGEVSAKREVDSKICGKRIKIGAEIGIKGIIQAALKFILEKSDVSAEIRATTGYGAHAATTGYDAHAATTGNRAHAATTGDRAHAATTGDDAHAATTGYGAHAATTGDWAHAATTGYDAHAATTGNRAHAATTGDRAHAATTGDVAHAATTGDDAHAATTGYRAHAEVKGRDAIAAALGIGARVKGALGCWLVCAEWVQDEEYNWHLVGVHSAKVDGDTIKADTWYTVKGGKFTEIEEDKS